MTILKICGLTQPEHVSCCTTLDVEFLGFVAYPKSPRHVEPELFQQLIAAVPPPTKTVLVTVDAPDALLDSYLTPHKPDFIQCHGDESPDRLQEIRNHTGCRIIKAISNLALAETYTTTADSLLIDAKPAAGELPGGNARTADWEALRNFASSLPWFLSGGLTAQNVAEALRTTGATMLDVSSGVERERGVKDTKLIEEFIHAARNPA